MTGRPGSSACRWGGRDCLQSGRRSRKRSFAGLSRLPLVAPRHRLRATGATRRPSLRHYLAGPRRRVAVIACNQGGAAARRHFRFCDVASCRFATRVASNPCHPAFLRRQCRHWSICTSCERLRKNSRNAWKKTDCGEREQGRTQRVS